MARVILGGPDYALTAAYAGGGWQAGLPVTNLRNPAFAAVARSNSTAVTDTKTQVMLATASLVKVVAIPYSTLSTAALFRVRLFDGAGALTTDSGWLPLLPAGTTAADATKYPMPAVWVVPGAPSTLTILLELDDHTNPAGYVDVGRVVFAAGWQPSRNAEYGASIVTEDPSTMQAGWGGGEYFDPRPKRRVVRFSLGAIPDAEANQQALDFQRMLGVAGQIFFVWDADDLANRHRRSFLCRMRTIPPLVSASWGANGQAFELSEVIA